MIVLNDVMHKNGSDIGNYEYDIYA